MSDMTAVKGEDGLWHAASNEAWFGPFKTLAEAWRWIDRVEGDPISPAEKRAEYRFSRQGEETRQ